MISDCYKKEEIPDGMLRDTTQISFACQALQPVWTSNQTNQPIATHKTLRKTALYASTRPFGPPKSIPKRCKALLALPLAATIRRNAVCCLKIGITFYRSGYNWKKSAQHFVVRRQCRGEKPLQFVVSTNSSNQSGLQNVVAGIIAIKARYKTS